MLGQIRNRFGLRIISLFRAMDFQEGQQTGFFLPVRDLKEIRLLLSHSRNVFPFLNLAFQDLVES